MAKWPVAKFNNSAKETSKISTRAQISYSPSGYILLPRDYLRNCQLPRLRLILTVNDLARQLNSIGRVAAL